jgi:hypothetical protein
LKFADECEVGELSMPNSTPAITGVYQPERHVPSSSPFGAANFREEIFAKGVNVF